MSGIESTSGEHCSLVIYAGMLLTVLPPDHGLRPVLQIIERARTRHEIRSALEQFAQAATAPCLMQGISQVSRDLITEMLALCPPNRSVSPPQAA